MSRGKIAGLGPAAYLRRPSVAAVARLAVACAGLAGCTDRDLTSADPSDPPGQGSATREVFLSAIQLSEVGWFDTTLVGFAGPADAAFLLVAQDSNFASRALLRFPSISSRVLIQDTTREARSFSDGRFLLRLDSTRSAVPMGGVLTLYDVERAFDARTANWTFAVDTPGAQVAWTVPGGTLGAPIASDSFGPNAIADTVIVDGDTLVGFLVLELGAATDSLLRAWGDTVNPPPGLVLAVQTMADVRVAFPVPSLQYQVQPDVTPDTTVSRTSRLTVRTFIFDPPLPDPGPRLALAGLPAARSYLEVRLPDSVDVSGVPTPLRGATVNRAELRLTSRPLTDPFVSRVPFGVRTFSVVDDVRRFGAKTPIGAEVLEGRATVTPDSLPDGARFEVAVTSVVQAWASTPLDSTAFPVRFVVRADPEAVGVGNWTFAGSGEPGEPVLRVVFTPDTEFRLP